MLPSMRTRRILALALLTSLLAPVLALAQGRGKPKRILFFTKSAGYEHAVIKVTGDRPSLAHQTLMELGRKHGFEITHSKDGRVFSAPDLAGYDGFIFYTSGDLTKPGTDGQPPMTPEGKAALLAAVAGGKGLIGLHLASGTFPSPGDRFQGNGDAVDPFLEMLGGEFIFHGPQATARVLCTGAGFPGLGDCQRGKSFDLHEEWYSYKNLRPDLHVLHVVATWSLKNTGKDSVYRRPPYPITWVRREGKGRVFYTGLGHRDDVWTSSRFQELLVGGIQWATGVVKAPNLKPNIATVAPGFDQLPPNDVPPSASAATPADAGVR